MFPLTIKDLPVEAWDFIDALGLVPVKLTNDYAPEIFWTIYADSDCLSLATESGIVHSVEDLASFRDSICSEGKYPLYPRHKFKPFVYLGEPYQFEIEWPIV